MPELMKSFIKKPTISGKQPKTASKWWLKTKEEIHRNWVKNY